MTLQVNCIEMFDNISNSAPSSSQYSSGATCCGFVTYVSSLISLSEFRSLIPFGWIINPPTHRLSLLFLSQMLPTIAAGSLFLSCAWSRTSALTSVLHIARLLSWHSCEVWRLRSFMNEETEAKGEDVIGKSRSLASQTFLPPNSICHCPVTLSDPSPAQSLLLLV